MATYRMYYGDLAGKIFTAQDLEASDDQEAVDIASTKGWSAVYEVWDRRRLVHRHPTDARLSGPTQDLRGREEGCA
jgi:hypothetical protein